MKTVQEYVKHAIAKAGGKHEDLARVLNINKSSICRYALGTRTPTTLEAIRLAKYLRIRPFFLMLLCEAERNNDEAAKKVWLELTSFIYDLKI